MVYTGDKIGSFPNNRIFYGTITRLVSLTNDEGAAALAAASRLNQN